MASVETFWEAGHKITGHDVDGSLSLGYRRFRAFFGTSPLVCVVAWDMMSLARPRTSRPEHLLWALLLLKRYSVEDVNAALTGVSEKTFRKWSHIFINLLADMPVVGETCHIQIFYQFIHFLQFFSINSFAGKIVSEALQETHLLLFLLMEPILKSWNHQTLIQNGGPTNSMAPVCDMRLAFAYAPGILFGLSEDFRAANGRIFGLLEMQLLQPFNQEKKL
jgi:hypothetical protein